MTKFNFYKMMVVALVAMVSVNANAQRHGGREMHVSANGVRMENRMSGHHDGGYTTHLHNGYVRGHIDARRHEGNNPVGHIASAPAPHWDRHGYLPGWEGRVRYYNGRYGYLRGRDWYWYDTYYEPDYYYAHPVDYFHHVHIGSAGRAVVRAVAGAAVIAGVIAAIAH